MTSIFKVLIGVAALLLAIGAVLTHRRRVPRAIATPSVEPGGSTAVRAIAVGDVAGTAVARTDASYVVPTRPAAPPTGSVAAAIDTAQLAAANARAAQRLWRLAFAAPSQAQASDRIHQRVRSNIIALLQVDTLNPKLFPRRPALLPQLLQVVNDPTTASEKIARMIAYDPVLTADVLRLANSSLYRVSTTPIETIQRAIVVCGVDSLRGMLAAALLRPVFRATRSNFPRLPRMLWGRTERATRAAEVFALATGTLDRFEAQLVVLLAALGPLVAYGATLDVYARNPHFVPDGDLCCELITDLSPAVSQHIAREWDSAPRLIDALDAASLAPLAVSRQVGELLGTLSFLEAQTVISSAERTQELTEAGIPSTLLQTLWADMAGAARPNVAQTGSGDPTY